MQISNSTLRKFLAVDRFAELKHQFDLNSRSERPPDIGGSVILLSTVIALLPPVGILVQRQHDTVDYPTVFMGIALLLALLLRSSLKLPFTSISHWRDTLRIITTAFSIGCIPIALILVFHKEALYVVSDHTSLQEHSTTSAQTSHTVLFILQIAVWAGLCEEFIYRGLLLAVLRRIRGLGNSVATDWIAIVVSAGIFAVGHIPAWGLTAAFAVFGLGIGFGIAYVAIGEAILPLVVFHICFDVLSLSFAYLTYKL